MTNTELIMTNADAIEVLKDELECGSVGCYEKGRQALELAIHALELSIQLEGSDGLTYQAVYQQGYEDGKKAVQNDT